LEPFDLTRQLHSVKLQIGKLATRKAATLQLCGLSTHQGQSLTKLFQQAQIRKSKAKKF
jgi:hypothetical protein